MRKFGAILGGAAVVLALTPGISFGASGPYGALTYNRAGFGSRSFDNSNSTFELNDHKWPDGSEELSVVPLVTWWPGLEG